MGWGVGGSGLGDFLGGCMARDNRQCTLPAFSVLFQQFTQGRKLAYNSRPTVEAEKLNRCIPVKVFFLLCI